MIFSSKNDSKYTLKNRCTSFILAISLALPPVFPSELSLTTKDKIKAAETTVKYGDVNNDDKINILDMISLKSYITDENKNNFSVIAADLDDDGFVSVKDAVELSLFLLNQINIFSYEQNIDSDKDGLYDYLEKEILKTDYLKADTDGDDLNDYAEIYFCGTDPLVIDTDNSGTIDSLKDSDNDKLSNVDEVKLGTSPTIKDTDEDGLDDYDEVSKYKTDPLSTDTDGDGISDNGELLLGLDPTKEKSNGKTSDKDVAFNQKLSPENANLKILNENNSSYNLEVTAKTTGYIDEILTVSKSRYSGYLNENEIIGDIVDIDIADTFKFDNIGITFDLNNIDNSNNYMVFKYSDSATMLLPVYTEYDGSKLCINDIDDGTYCVANVDEITNNIIDELSYETEILSAVEVAKADNKLSTLNLIYEICIDNNCKVPSWNSISSAIIETAERLGSKGYNVNVAITFTIYGYSVDISCDNSSELKNILNVATSFFNDPSITNLNAAYNVYQKNRNDNVAVWKDFSNYYSANNNIALKSNYNNNNIVFIINSKNQATGKCCCFDISGVSCITYNAYFALYRKMFDNEIRNNINGSPSDVMTAIALYVANINSKTPAKRNLFGKILLNNANNQNSDSDSDGKPDNNELNYSQRTTLGAVVKTSSILYNGKEQLQSILNNKSSQPIELNDMEVIPEISDPSRIDSDEDGINDSEDNAPREKGIYNDDNKLITGELTLLSCKGASALDIIQGDPNTGHAFLLYKSYVNDILDLSMFNSGYDYCNSDTPNRNYNPSNYNIKPEMHLAIGAGGFDLNDAQSVVYNMEFFKGHSYIPNAYIKKEIGSDEWDKLINAASAQADLEYKPIIHNCTHVAIYIWNHSTSADYNPFNNVHLVGIDTPTSLYNHLSRYNDVMFDLAVNQLSR